MVVPYKNAVWNPKYRFQTAFVYRWIIPEWWGGFSEHSEVLGLKRTVVDEDGNESTDTFIDPSYRNLCIDLEMSHPELFSWVAAE